MRSSIEIIEGTEPVETDLISLEDLKLELGITDSSEDEQLQARIARESKAIAEYCGRIFAMTDVIETFTFDLWEGVIGRPLNLRNYPVEYVDGITQSDADAEYLLDAESGQIWPAEGGTWGGTVVVSYSAGYDLPDGAPAGLQTAIIESIRQKRAFAARDPSVRETSHEGTSVGYFSGSESAGSFTQSVRDMLRQYKRPGFA